MEKSRSCDWCCGGSILDVGSGIFRDFDSDFSYGVPVCPGCGGLGIIVDSTRFKELSDKIYRLRFEYCPGGGKELPQEELRKKFKELIGAVQEIYREFGNKNMNCYAKGLLERAGL